MAAYIDQIEKKSSFERISKLLEQLKDSFGRMSKPFERISKSFEQIKCSFGRIS